jgi:hypothetical protein
MKMYESKTSTQFDTSDPWRLYLKRTPITLAERQRNHIHFHLIPYKSEDLVGSTAEWGAILNDDPTPGNHNPIPIKFFK